MEAAGIVLQGGRTLTGSGGDFRRRNGGEAGGPGRGVEGDGHAALVGSIVDPPSADGGSVFFHEESLGDNLRGIGLFGSALSGGVALGRAFFVVAHLHPLWSAFSDIYNADESKNLAVEPEAAEFCAFRQTEISGIIQFGGTVYI